jgi:hypothetical protein
LVRGVCTRPTTVWWTSILTVAKIRNIAIFSAILVCAWLFLAGGASVSERPSVLFTYSHVTPEGKECPNGRIEKRREGWVEMIPQDAACHRQTLGYTELGEDDDWFYMFHPARNMTARVPKAGGNVNWLSGKVFPEQGASKQWNVSQSVTRVNESDR